MNGHCEMRLGVRWMGYEWKEKIAFFDVKMLYQFKIILSYYFSCNNKLLIIIIRS